MKTYRTIDPAYYEHFEAYARDARRAGAKAVKSKQQRSLVAAVYQMANRCGGATGKKANTERICRTVKTMARKGVGLLACPEMCLQGYYTFVDGTSQQGRSAGRSLADRVETSPEIRALRNAARKARMVLVFGFSEVGGRGGKKVYNSIGVIDSDGSWLGSHRKNPLYPWDYELDVFDQPAKAKRISVFKTRVATIGVANCFDGSFPETVRGMRRAGAEMMVWCNAAVGDCKRGNFDRVVTSAGYAIANNICVLCCNGASENLSGTSHICDARGVPQVILPADQEACGLADLDLGMTTDWDLYRTRLVLNPAEQPARP